jgi:hypothetical protein
MAEAAADTDGRVAVIWGTKDKMQAQLFEPGKADQPAFEVPSLYTPCMTRDRVWGQNNGIAISFGGGRPVFQKNLVEFFLGGEIQPGVHFRGTESAGLPDPQTQAASMVLQGCTPDAAIFRDRRDSRGLIVCADDCKQASLPEGAPEYATTAYAKGKVIGIASHGGVLGVWREGAKPQFYGLPEDAHPVLAHEWYALALTNNEVIDVIARGEKTFVVIRIPAG